MNLGIISSSDYNLFGSTLISRLVGAGRTPRLLLCAERSRIQRVRRYYRRNGMAQTVRKLAEVRGVGGRRRGAIRGRLAAYADAHGLEEWDQPIPALCKQHGIEYVRTPSVNAPAAIDAVGRLGVELMLNAGGEIIRKPLIDSLAHGVFNAHMGELPPYRGYNVLEWSLFYGDPIGMTLHFIDPGIDTGDILRFEEIPWEAGDDLDTLRAKSYPLAIDLTLRGIELLEKEELPATPQDEAAGKQYFAMHPRLKEVVENGLRTRTSA